MPPILRFLLYTSLGHLILMSMLCPCIQWSLVSHSMAVAEAVTKSSQAYLQPIFCKLLNCVHNCKCSNVLDKRYVCTCKIEKQWCTDLKELPGTFVVPAMLTLLNRENIKHPAGESHLFPPLPTTQTLCCMTVLAVVLGQGKGGDTFSTNLLVCYADCIVRNDSSVLLQQSLCRLQLACCKQRAAKFNLLW